MKNETKERHDQSLKHLKGLMKLQDREFYNDIITEAEPMTGRSNDLGIFLGGA